MASFALTDVGLWIHTADFSGYSNQVSLNVSADELESTTFGSGGYRSRKGGVKDVEAEVSGFWESGPGPDSEIFSDLGVVNANRAVAFCPTATTEGTVAYIMQAGKFTYEAFGSHGELTPFSLGMKGTEGTSGLVRGNILKAKGNVSSTGQLGSVVSSSGVGASQYLYVAFFIFSLGTSITVQVQSDDGAGFGSPTTQATLGPMTAAGGYWMTRVPGTITDSFWRLNVSAVTGTHQVAAAFGIA